MLASFHITVLNQSKIKALWTRYFVVVLFDTWLVKAGLTTTQLGFNLNGTTLGTFHKLVEMLLTKLNRLFFNLGLCTHYHRV